MRKISTILLCSMILIPLFWNGMNFIHYLVEHTHTFCASEEDHQHSSSDDCSTVYHISPHHEQNQIPHKVEFYELKHFLNTFFLFDTKTKFSKHTSTNINFSLLYGRILSEDILRPPIS